MNLRIAKWGNSLALRIPSDMARRFNCITGIPSMRESRSMVRSASGLQLQPRAAFAAEIDSAREAIPPGASVMDELRGKARY